AGLVGQVGSVTHDLDRALLVRLGEVTASATEHMAAYDYAHALREVESFFWEFTDDYVELVKDRSYGAGTEEDQLSAHVTLATALDVLLRLFAPIMPFVTEEVWSWWRTGSVHRAPWPGRQQLIDPMGSVDPGLLTSVAAVLSEIRRAKTEAKVSQKTPVLSLSIEAPAQITGAVAS
ncbi:valine--tRNA ligase, partial [Burkholderia multivorans]